jgi:Lrp/AsnC family leucine-responsive transcriptional regulator
VLELHHLAGEDCFLVKVRARDTDDLYRFLRDELGRFKAIKSTRTTIVLKTVKETTGLPLDRERAGD